jgi:hypothetical protein
MGGFEAMIYYQFGDFEVMVFKRQKYERLACFGLTIYSLLSSMECWGQAVCIHSQITLRYKLRYAAGGGIYIIEQVVYTS